MIIIQCELCGCQASLVTALIENSRMSVCSKCATFGKILHTKTIHVQQKKQFIAKPVVIIDNYSEVIKQARELKQLKQEEVASALKERVSIVQKLESGHHMPSIVLAKKFERFFNITLIEAEPEKKDHTPPATSKGLTIGDLLSRE